MDEPHTRITVLTAGKNASDPFSVGVVLNITCDEGYRLNVGNRTVRCKKGIWKPDHPTCLLSNFELYNYIFLSFLINFAIQMAVPCEIPDIENAAFRYNDETVAAQTEIPHNETVQFDCGPGYVVQGAEVYHCSFGEFISSGHTQKSECVPAPCELPRLSHGDYASGYRAGLTIANGSTVDYSCGEPDYVKITGGPVQCRLGELAPDYPACKTRADRFGVDGKLFIAIYSILLI